MCTCCHFSLRSGFSHCAMFVSSVLDYCHMFYTEHCLKRILKIQIVENKITKIFNHAKLITYIVSVNSKSNLHAWRSNQDVSTNSPGPPQAVPAIAGYAVTTAEPHCRTRVPSEKCLTPDCNIFNAKLGANTDLCPSWGHHCDLFPHFSTSVAGTLHQASIYLSLKTILYFKVFLNPSIFHLSEYKNTNMGSKEWLSYKITMENMHLVLNSPFLKHENTFLTLNTKMMNKSAMIMQNSHVTLRMTNNFINIYKNTWSAGLEMDIHRCQVLIRVQDS